MEGAAAGSPAAAAFWAAFHALTSISGPPLLPAAPVLMMPRFFFFSSFDMLTF